jgi:hypothetical protein
MNINTQEDTTDKIVYCQHSKGYRSCLQCEQVVTCKIRLAYVYSVYKSMNPNIDKDNNGFNF